MRRKSGKNGRMVMRKSRSHAARIRKSMRLTGSIRKIRSGSRKQRILSGRWREPADAHAGGSGSGSEGAEAEAADGEDEKVGVEISGGSRLLLSGCRNPGRVSDPE